MKNKSILRSVILIFIFFVASTFLSGCDISNLTKKTNLIKQKNPSVSIAKLTTTPTSTTKKMVELFNTGNIGAVDNGGVPPTIKLNKKVTIKQLYTYHWNYGQGKEGGKINIKDMTGKAYGPWEVYTEPGQGGVPNAYWKVDLNLTLEPGSYIITDSDQGTWSQNSESGGYGMTGANGYID